MDSGDPRPWPDLPRQLGTLPPCCGGSQGQQGAGMCTGDSHLGCGQVVLALKQVGGASPPVCAGVSPGLLEF